MKKEKSGLEMLEELLYEVQTLRKELKVMDQKVAQIANSTKVTEIVDRIMGTNFEDWGRSKPKVAVSDGPRPKAEPAEPATKGISNFKFERSDASKTEQVQPDRGRTRSAKAILVSGKMITEINKKEVALSGLKVIVYDNKDNVIKTTKTNRAGKWMSHLPPGEYLANIEGEYKGQSLVPVNIMFEVKEGMESLEVK